MAIVTWTWWGALALAAAASLEADARSRDHRRVGLDGQPAPRGSTSRCTTAAGDCDLRAVGLVPTWPSSLVLGCPPNASCDRTVPDKSHFLNMTAIAIRKQPRDPHCTHNFHGTTLLMSTFLFDNYYHFFANHICPSGARAADLGLEPGSYRLLLHAPFDSKHLQRNATTQLEFLHALSPTVLTTADFHSSQMPCFDRLIVGHEYTLMQTAPAYDLTPCNPVVDTILTKFHNPTSTPTELGCPHVVLLLRQPPTLVRRILNSDELSRAMREALPPTARLTVVSFEKPPPHTSNAVAQVNLFRTAHMLVSSHGSGLSNALFMPNGSILLQLLPEGGLLGASSFFQSYAKGRGVRHEVFQAGPTGDLEALTRGRILNFDVPVAEFIPEFNRHVESVRQTFCS